MKILATLKGFWTWNDHKLIQHQPCNEFAVLLTAFVRVTSRVIAALVSGTLVYFVLCLCVLIPYSANGMAYNRATQACDYHILQAALLLTV